MPIDPFLALNAMIRAEVTRSSVPTDGSVGTDGPASARGSRIREARTEGRRETDSRTDDVG